MLQNNIRPTEVEGPSGEILTHCDLPKPNTTRWVARRKAEVVAAVNGGLLTIAEACSRYNLTLEELASWQRMVDRAGVQGLRVTKLQAYRDEHIRKERHL